jgi:hypothetical protein
MKTIDRLPDLAADQPIELPTWPVVIGALVFALLALATSIVSMLASA